MCCTPDSNDYHQPQQETYQRPVPRPQRQQVHHPQRRQQSDYERRRVQAHATQAAHNYGWAGQSQQQRRRDNHHAINNRDSYIEPGLGQALFGLPGSDYRELTSARRQTPAASRGPAPPTRPLHYNYPSAVGAGAFPAAPKPAYHHVSSSNSSSRAPLPTRQQPSRYRATAQRPMPIAVPGGAPHGGVVQQQPARAQPMRIAAPVQQARMEQRQPMASVSGGRPLVMQGTNPYAARQQQRPQQPAQQPQGAAMWDFVPKKPVRRDSNGVSEFDEDEDDDPDSWRHHTVSPNLVSPREKLSSNLYGQMGMGYGRTGAF